MYAGGAGGEFLSSLISKYSEKYQHLPVIKQEYNRWQTLHSQLMNHFCSCASLFSEDRSDDLDAIIDRMLNIIEKTININYLISFDYKNMNTVMRIIKEKSLNIIHQKLEMNCQITLSIRKNEADFIFKKNQSNIIRKYLLFFVNKKICHVQ